jgi:hypothetical protein
MPTAPRCSLQSAARAIAGAVGEDPAAARRRFRHWAGLGLILATTTGAGVGTRRTYSTAAVLLGAVLALLARHGVEGNGLQRLGRGLGQALDRRGFENLRRYGGLLFVDLDSATQVSAQIRMPGAPALPPPETARLAIDVGALAERIAEALGATARVPVARAIHASRRSRDPAPAQRVTAKI